MSKITFYKSIRPLLRTSRTFGLTAFKLHDSSYEYSKINVAVNVFLMIGYLAMAVHSLYQRLQVKTSLLVITTDLMQVITATIQTVVSWGVCALFQKKFMSLLTRISNLDKKFWALGVYIYYDSVHKTIAHRLIWHFSFGTACIATQIFAFDYAFMITLIGFNICYYLPVYINLSVVQQIYTYNELLKYRFEILNDHLVALRNVGDYRDTRVAHISLTKPLSSKLSILRTICPIHHELTKIAKLVNRTFGIMLLLSFGVAFVTIIVCLYDASTQLQIFTWGRLKPLVGAIAMCATYVVDCLLLCHSCHSTVDAANKSGRLLHQIESDDMDVKDQIEMFSLQIVNERLEYTAAGFFTINYSLLFSIIGGITTYLIILIQFSATPSSLTE